MSGDLARRVLWISSPKALGLLQPGPAHLRQPGRAVGENHELHLRLLPQRGHHLLRHGRSPFVPSSPPARLLLPEPPRGPWACEPFGGGGVPPQAPPRACADPPGGWRGARGHSPQGCPSGLILRGWFSHVARRAATSGSSEPGCSPLCWLVQLGRRASARGQHSVPMAPRVGFPARSGPAPWRGAWGIPPPPPPLPSPRRWASLAT